MVFEQHFSQCFKVGIACRGDKDGRDKLMLVDIAMSDIFKLLAQLIHAAVYWCRDLHAKALKRTLAQ
jgi:hypothetical protein